PRRRPAQSRSARPGRSVEASAMTDARGLRVEIGGGAGRSSRPGFLSMGAHAHADVPYRPGEEFPFDDRAVDAIVCGDFVHGLDPVAQVGLLLECRRSLKPGGGLEIAAPERAGPEAAAELARAGAIVGLDAAAPFALAKRDRSLKTDPLVSIAIPAYNARFFTAALDSALAQTY